MLQVNGHLPIRIAIIDREALAIIGHKVIRSMVKM